GPSGVAVRKSIRVLCGVFVALLFVPTTQSASGAASPPEPLSHGPMIGHVAHDAAIVWFRTPQAAASVKLEYGTPGGPTSTTATVATKLASDFTGQLRMSGLAPD